MFIIGIGAQFREKTEITILREISLNRKRLYEKLSQYNLSKGGWMLSASEEYITKCPHCCMEYSNWKSDDDPLAIHKYLSPLCLFVLSSNPFGLNPIPIRKVEEQYTDQVIDNAEFRPYDGLAKAKHNRYSEVINRINSFEEVPHYCPNDALDLALSGFYYGNGKIACFYCSRSLSVRNSSTALYHCFINIHKRSGCRYSQQINDNGRRLSIQQSNIVVSSNKCTWCTIEDKRLVAVPCRHFCLCTSCGQIKQLCPICNENVTTYITIYRP